MCKCKCGTELTTEKKWMGPEGYEMLGYDFAMVTVCPNRHFWNFWKHDAATHAPCWMPGSLGYKTFHVHAIIA
jgi:hypothetical protein